MATTEIKYTVLNLATMPNLAALNTSWEKAQEAREAAESDARDGLLEGAREGRQTDGAREANNAFEEKVVKERAAQGVSVVIPLYRMREKSRPVSAMDRKGLQAGLKEVTQMQDTKGGAEGAKKQKKKKREEEATEAAGGKKRKGGPDAEEKGAQPSGSSKEKAAARKAPKQEPKKKGDAKPKQKPKKDEAGEREGLEKVGENGDRKAWQKPG